MKTLEILPKMKALKQIWFISNPWVYNVLNYKSLMITKCSQVTEIDGEQITKKIRSNSKVNNIVFADRVKSTLVNTSAVEMKRTPSFTFLLVRMKQAKPDVELASFVAFKDVLTDVLPIYLVIAAQKLEVCNTK